MTLALIPSPPADRPVENAARRIEWSSRAAVGLHWLILLLTAVIVTKRMWAPALLAGHSAWFDLARMVEFDAAIRSGDWLPLWSPDFYHGYGSPLFQYYAPLAYFLTEAPVLAGADIPTALKVTQLVALFASGLAMYSLAATHLSRWAACLGGILYMAAPYRLVDIFVRHALAEHCAFVWLPLVVLGTQRFVANRSRTGLLMGVLATAGLVLTHNVMAMIGLPVCVATGWVLGAPDWKAPNFFFSGLPALLGVGLATFFWWPAISGRPLTLAEESLTGGYFDYRRNFVDVWSFLNADWGFGESAPGATGGRMSQQIGWLHLLAGMGAAGLLLLAGRRGLAPRRKPDLSESPFTASPERWLVAGLIVMVGSILMCHGISQPVWDALPLVKYVQFPWRFLGLVVFGAAMCGAAVLDRAGFFRPRWEWIAFALALAAVLAIYLPCYAEARFVAIDGRSNQLLRTTADRLRMLEAAGALVPAALLVTPESMRAAGERATSSDDFLPRTVRKKPGEVPAGALTATSGEVRHCSRLAQNRYLGTVAMREAGRVELAQFWFPGWAAWVDGQEVETTPAGEMAVASCALPAGEHVVEFRYLGLPQRRASIYISWIFCVMTVMMLAISHPARAAALQGGRP